MATTKTQCERLREYLVRYGEVTPMQALSDLGIYRLGARIFDLRREGMPILTEDEKVGTRHGTAIVARYVLNRPAPFREMKQIGWFTDDAR